MKIVKDNEASIKMVGSVVAILVTLIISILVFYNIAGSIDTSDLDDDISDARGLGTWPSTNNTDATNATDNILDQSETFYTIAPIIAIVIVAVVILGYVGKL